MLPDRATYRARWSALHGGYDPAGSVAANGWLTLVEAVARPVARRRIAPDTVTVAALACAAAAVPAAALGGRWPLGAAAAVLGSAFADSLDGAVAVLSDRTTAWGYVADSMADRAADTLFLLALRRVGAPAGLTLAAAAGIVALEYARARAGNAGLGEIGVVTVGERPNRVLLTAAGLAVAGELPGKARLAGSVAAGAMAVLASVGAGQFLRVAARELGSRQAGPIIPATV